MRRLVLAAALLPTVALAQSAGTLVDPRTVPNAPLIGATQINQAMTTKVDVNGGAAGATMSPAGPGSIARTLASHFADRVNVKDYGAVGDGVTDDTAALASAIAYANSLLATGNSVSLYLPRGRYLASSIPQLNATVHETVSLLGDGNGASKLVLSTTAQGFDVVFSAASNGSVTPSGRANIEGLGVEHTSAVTGNAGIAFQVIGYSNGVTGGQFNDLRCDPQSSPFADCLYIQDSNDNNVSNIHYEGAPTATGLLSQGTAVLIGSSASGYSVDNTVTNVAQTGGFAGVATSGHVEGLHVNDATIVGAAYGVYSAAFNNSTTGILFSTVANSHFNVLLRGIYAEQASSWKIHHNLIYQFARDSQLYADVVAGATLPSDNLAGPLATQAGWYGIDLINPSTSQIDGNQVYGFGIVGGGIFLHVAAINGAAAQACNQDTVTSNVVTALGASSPSFLVDSACSYVTVMGNIAYVTGPYSFGPGAFTSNNYFNGSIADAAYNNGSFRVPSSVTTPTININPAGGTFPLQMTADGSGNAKIATTLATGAGTVEVGPNVQLDGSTTAKGTVTSVGLVSSAFITNAAGTRVFIPDAQIGAAVGLDQFTGPDSFTIGGTALPDTPAGWASSAPAFNPTVNMITAPYGAFNAGCGLCLFMSQDNITANRAGISGVDYRTGASAMPAIGSNDAVGFYEQPQNYPAKFVLQAASYTPTEVVLKTPLTAEQISLLRTNMYLVTNSIDPTSPTGAASDGLPVNNLMEGFISGWDPAGTYINVAGWASVSGTGVSNAVPSTTALDTAYSTYSNPTVFIGAPTKVWGRNTYINYQTAGSNPTTSLIRRFEGEEMDWRYNASKANEVDFHGITMSFAPTGGVGPAGMTSDSYALLMNGVLPRYVIIQDSGAAPVLIDTGFYQMGSNGESTTTPNAEMFEHDAYADGANELRLEGRVIHTGTATGWPGAEMDLGLWIDGGQGTSGGTYAGGLKFNAGGTSQASVSLCGQSGCAIQAQANGLPKIVNVTYSQLPACAANLEGTVAEVIDATVATFNAAITAGGGSNHMMGRCNGTAWVVD